MKQRFFDVIFGACYLPCGDVVEHAFAFASYIPAQNGRMLLESKRGFVQGPALQWCFPTCTTGKLWDNLLLMSLRRALKSHLLPNKLNQKLWKRMGPLEPADEDLRLLRLAA